MSQYLSVFTSVQQNFIVQPRLGESRLGENIQIISNPNNWQEEINESEALFVLLGIPEDIGVRANGGIGGTQTAWEPSLKALLNIQSTTKFLGSQLLVLGHFDFSNWMDESQNVSVENLRPLVAKLDDEIFPVVQNIIASGKIPIVIGGGHNNAYPLLKGASNAFNQSVNCINLDAHSDFRFQEGRHSGNGFRYAKNEDFLAYYAIIGLHENYNSEAVLIQLIESNKVNFSFYEDIFLRNKIDFEQAVLEAINFTDGRPTGIELDLDAIANVLSSASSPIGISTLQARQYLQIVADKSNPCYLHIAEGATKLANGKEDLSTGKLIAYLISDFIKATI